MTDLTSEARAPVEPVATPEPIWTRQTGLTIAALLALLVLADVLFYPHQPGVSLAIYVLALVGLTLALHPAALRDFRTLGLVAAAVLAAVPLIESENWLWALFALGVVGLAAMAASGNLPNFDNWFGAVTRFTVLAPMRLIADAFRLLGEAGRQKFGGRLVRAAMVWIVPAVCAVVFAFLFLAANPVLEEGFHAIRLETLFQLLDPLRVSIWGFFAIISWPVLAPRLLRWGPVAEMRGLARPAVESLVFGAAAIRNSLIVFNVLFAVQTLMDLAFLWGGLRLPDNLTYADYAHRGAYPLIVTAVLAGAFVLAAMRRNGPGSNSPLIRNLVYLWVAQNVWLVVSSILRLDIYVDAYGLSEMRIAAGVWMLLVAVGLILIIAKIVYDKSNKWLVTANTVALLVALWGVALLNFPATIADFNVAHAREMTGGDGAPLDTEYMEGLGPDAIPALDLFIIKARFADADLLKTVDILRDNLTARVLYFDSEGQPSLQAMDWQSWTWRQQRLGDYLLKQPLAPLPPAR